MTELKPCPFCGSIDVEVIHCDEVCSICCDNCHAGYWSDDSSDAESIWNNRPSPWRSLKDDPPEYPAPIGKSILVRRGMGGYSGTTSYRWRQHKVLDQEPEKALRNGWKEWMEVPE